MAVRTSTQAGNWSDSATWGGAAAPGSVDTAIIGHAVTVDVNTTVGNNLGSTNGITLNAGSITIPDGITLTVSARLTAASSAATISVGTGVGAGATLTFTNSGGVAGIITGANVTVNVTGKSGSRSTISYTGSGGQAIISCGAGATNLYLKTSYANITAMTNSGGGMFVGSDASGFTTIDHTAFSSCENIEIRATASANITVTNNTWTGTIGNNCFTNNCIKATTGTRTISGNCFDKFANMQSGATGSFQNFVFDNNLCESQVQTQSGQFVSFKDNLLAANPVGLSWVAQADICGQGTYKNNYLYSLLTGSNNSHFWNINGLVANTTMTFDGNVYHFGKTGTTGDLGDGVLANQGTDLSHTLVIDCVRELVIPSDGGMSSGMGINVAKKAKGVAIGAQHCTYCVTSVTPLDDTARAGGCGELGAVGALLGTAIIPYFRSNICWSSTADGGYKTLLSPDQIDGGVGESWTATGGDATHLNDTGRAWAVNIFTAAGTYKVRLTSGANSGSVGTITANAATQLTVTSWSIGAPANGDTYKIYIVDAITPAEARYNCGWNTAAGEAYDSNGAIIGSGQGNGYHQSCSSTDAALGTSDISADPTFVDSTRNIQTWDTSLGGAGTGANAIAELRKRNDDSGYNSAYTITALVAWVKLGFVPTNAALTNAGHDGLDIGAVDAAVLTGTAVGGITEADVVAGGKVITISLTSDSFIPS